MIGNEPELVFGTRLAGFPPSCSFPPVPTYQFPFYMKVNSKRPLPSLVCHTLMRSCCYYLNLRIKKMSTHQYWRLRSFSSSILSLVLCSWSPTWLKGCKIKKNTNTKFSWLPRTPFRISQSPEYCWVVQNISQNIPRSPTSISALMFSHTGLFSRLRLPLSSLSLSSLSFRARALT